MKTSLKFTAMLCAILIISVSSMAQTFTATFTGTWYKVSGMSLVTLTSPATINPNDVIVMPFTGGTSSNTPVSPFLSLTANPSGVSPISYSWEFKGDIGLNTGGGTGATASVGTINRRDRATTYDYGQSKGRVRFYWSNTGSSCGQQFMQFDIIKSWSQANAFPSPPIIGPTCLLPLTKYTYSVDPIMSDNLADQIGIDRYFWDISAVTGATGVYWSTDSSSITFTTGATVPSTATINCGFGLANNVPWVGTQQAYSTLLLSQGAALPVVTLSGAISGTASATNCIPTYATGTGTHSLTLSVPTQSGVTFQWSFGTYGLTADGWNTSPPATGTLPFTSSGTVVGSNNQLTIADVGNQPGTVTLKVTDACGNIAYYTYNFSRSISATTASLLSFNSTCDTANGTLTATLATSANLSNVSFTPLTNWTFGTSNPYSIYANSSVVPGSYTVSAALGCGSALAYTVYVKPQKIASSVTPTCLPTGTTGAGSLVNTSPASLCSGCTFSWSIPGASGVTQGTATYPTTSLNTTTTATSTVATGTYTVTAGCATTVADSIFIQPNTPTINGPACFNYGFAGTYAFNVAAVSGSAATDYHWTCSVAGSSVSSTVLSGGNANVTVTVPGGVTSNFTVSLSITNRCGTITPTTYTATVSKGNMAAGNFSPGAYTLYFVSGTVPSGSAYQWFQDGNIVAGETSSSYSGSVSNTTVTNVWCRITLPSGCIDTVTTAAGLYIKMAPAHGGSSSQISQFESIKVFPNPNVGAFTINVSKAVDAGSVTIYDATGKEVAVRKVSQGDNAIESKELAPGTYMLLLRIDGETSAMPVVITK